MTLRVRESIFLSPLGFEYKYSMISYTVWVTDFKGKDSAVCGYTQLEA